MQTIHESFVNSLQAAKQLYHQACKKLNNCIIKLVEYMQCSISVGVPDIHHIKPNMALTLRTANLQKIHMPLYGELLKFSAISLLCSGVNFNRIAISPTERSLRKDRATRQLLSNILRQEQKPILDANRQTKEIDLLKDFMLPPEATWLF